MRKIVSYLTIICLLSITFSCGGGGSSKGVSSVTILASFKTSSTSSTAIKAQATTLTNIRYTVSGSGMDTMTDTVPVTGNLVEFTLNVPNGPQRHFLIEALDSSNYVRYKGEAYRDLDGTPVTIEITLVGEPLIGTWGYGRLRHNNDGTWHARSGKITFNIDGTGTDTFKDNNNGTLSSGVETFTYSLITNQDGSLNVVYTYPDRTQTRRYVISDDRKMMITDGTDNPNMQRIRVFVKLDTSKIYTNADLSGNYYTIGYEHDALGGTKGYYRAWSGVLTANGSGNYTMNSTLNGGGNILPDTQIGTYSVNTDGSGSIARDGSSSTGSSFLTGDGKLAVVSNPESIDDWANYFFMKKGDRIYTTADLAGTWALVGFGDENIGSSFFAQIATWTCDSNGTCAISIKRQQDGNIIYEITNRTFSVSPDGSFGASLSSLAPSYAGAIGNNGNTIILNRSFDPIELFNRRIIIGVRCSNCSNLTGQLAFERTPSLGFYGLGTQFQQIVDTLVSTPTLSDNIYNTPTTTSTGTINIGQNGNKFHNIGIQLFSSEKPVDTLLIYVNKNVTSDTNLTNTNNWRAYRSDFNLPATWTEITIQSVTVSVFDSLNNIYRYEIKFSNPQNALFFGAINMDQGSITDVLVTEIEAFGTDVVP